ncbi:hypothetical protein [Pseudomonas citronellolis]|nr:hypothetical protein [Pseudomonas citronellolis]MDF3931960.1 hypothetical protein [Pseudomonas citronellolis]
MRIAVTLVLPILLILSLLGFDFMYALHARPSVPSVCAAGQPCRVGP